MIEEREPAEPAVGCPSTRALPLSLRLVAGLCITFGTLSLFQALVLLGRNHISIDLGILQIPMGFGLLRLKRRWWTCALVFLRIGFVLLSIVTIVFLVHPGPFWLRWMGTPVGTVRREWAILSLLWGWALAVWEYRVLTSARVKALFETSSGALALPPA